MTTDLFAGAEYIAQRDDDRLLCQIDRVYATMKDEKWRSLDEIAAITKDPVASVSAQLRHLRKPHFGGYVVNRRSREGALFEYQVLPPGSAQHDEQIAHHEAQPDGCHDAIAHVRHLPIAEQMKYALARYVWPKQNVGMIGHDQRPTGKTWGQWFQERNKQSLLDYVEFCKANYEKPAGDRHANRSENR